MFTHDTTLFAKNNDKVTENNNFTNKIEFILPSVSEHNIPRNISNFDFSTRIKAESYNSEESDSAFDDKNELNLEHNWRNKNTSQTNKR